MILEGATIMGVKMDEHCTNMQGLVLMIRQYLLSKNNSIERPINGIFDVEPGLHEFRSRNKSITMDDENLRDILCSEALQLGMILHFG